MAEIIRDHVHGPDENGHHHLDLSALAERHGPKRELKPLASREANSEGKLWESPRVPPKGDGKK